MKGKKSQRMQSYGDRLLILMKLNVLEMILMKMMLDKRFAECILEKKVNERVDPGGHCKKSQGTNGFVCNSES